MAPLAYRKSLNQLWVCKSTLNNVCSSSWRCKAQGPHHCTEAHRIKVADQRYPNVSHKRAVFIYRSSALEQSNAGSRIGKNACRLCLRNVTLHVHFHGPYFDQFLWLSPGSGICLLGDGLKRPRELWRIFVEVTDMIADLIHGHWVLLCLIHSDADVLEM